MIWRKFSPYVGLATLAILIGIWAQYPQWMYMFLAGASLHIGKKVAGSRRG